MSIPTVAALLNKERGCYFNLPGVDPYDKQRDARTYKGPHRVVAHPPCERWGRYWQGGPSSAVKKLKGDDDGCFASALHSVRTYGGVLEHPEGSHAWSAFGLIKPPRKGGWVAAGDGIGWVCCVEQGHYGHLARKATWLYAAGVELPSLRWGKSEAKRGKGEIYSNEAERKRAVKTGACQRLSKKQRAATPIEFRDLLLSIARSTRHE